MGKRPEAVPANRERATPERLERAGGAADETSQYTVDKAGVGGRTEGVQRIMDSPLDRLNRRGDVPRRSFQAGNKFRSDAYLAGSGGVISSVDFERGGGSSPAFGRVPRSMVSESEAVVSARLSMERVKKHFHAKTMTVLERALLKEQSLEEIGSAVFGYASQRESFVAGRVAVLVMLGALADLYESLSPEGRRR